MLTKNKNSTNLLYKSLTTKLGIEKLTRASKETTMKMTTKDANILRVAVVPAFILASIIGAIAIMSFSISEAVTAESGVIDRERISIQRALAGRELGDRNIRFVD